MMLKADRPDPLAPESHDEDHASVHPRPQPLVIWLAGQAWSGHRAFNEEQRAHREPTVSPLRYLFRSNFWFESLQNWQSEFLAVGTLVVFSVYLRQRGSPESKPVHAPHASTGAD